MELVWTYLCFIMFLQSVSCNPDNDIISSRLDHFSISLARIARKQQVMETRLDSITASIKDHDLTDGKQENVLLGYLYEKAKEELFIMKRAIASEKEYVRTMSIDIGDKIAAVEATSVDLGSRIQSMEKGMDTVKATSGGLTTRVDSMESSITSLVSAAGRHVSFSVRYKPKGNVAILKKETTIKFNQVYYNDGSGYDETTGIFTVPVSGVYQFIFFIEGWQEKDDFSCNAAFVLFYVDSSVTTSAIAEPMHVQQNTQGGNAYINYLRKGQEVKLRTADDCDEYSIFAYRTTFSGVLLY